MHNPINAPKNDKASIPKRTFRSEPIVLVKGSRKNPRTASTNECREGIGKMPKLLHKK